MSTIKRTYVPKSKAKAHKTNFGDILKLGFHAESLINFCKQHANNAGYINLDVVPRRETDQYGNTHSVQLNDWKPGQSSAQPDQNQETPAVEKFKAQDDDVPF